MGEKRRQWYRGQRDRICARNRNKHQQNPLVHMLQSAKSRAKQRGIPFDLTLDDVVLPEFCPVLGIPIRVAAGSCDDNSPTLDRIDNQLGYTRDNTIVISRRANSIKNDATVDELIKLADFYSKVNDGKK